MSYPLFLFFFFFNDTATTEIYTLSLHDALPILPFQSKADDAARRVGSFDRPFLRRDLRDAELSRAALAPHEIDRKSTRLNSSHTVISYAVFCLKKKKSNST